MLIFPNAKTKPLMKKNTLLFLFSIILLFLVIGQGIEVNNEKKSEIKIDAFNLIAFEYIDNSYEYLIHEKLLLEFKIYRF
ncbi:MAG: hypothetical protein COA50_09370 [Flavobacteriaceae bacterium]|nr:MAG: hypothetical protein COA50_09370 [Flavobacteriaceae bacterium]